jgi:hypothetical protein
VSESDCHLATMPIIYQLIPKQIKHIQLIPKQIKHLRACQIQFN